MNTISYEGEKVQNISSLKGKKVLLYGAGNNFKRLVKNSPLLDLDIIAVADLKFLANREYLGLNAIPVNQIVNYDFDLILITVADYKPIIDIIEYRLITDKDIFYFEGNSVVKYEKKSDSFKIIKLLSDIDKSLKELLPNKLGYANSKFSPTHILAEQAAAQTAII